jgi:hypothetical protein
VLAVTSQEHASLSSNIFPIFERQRHFLIERFTVNQYTGDTLFFHGFPGTTVSLNLNQGHESIGSDVLGSFNYQVGKIHFPATGIRQHSEALII